MSISEFHSDMLSLAICHIKTFTGWDAGDASEFFPNPRRKIREIQ